MKALFLLIKTPLVREVCNQGTNCIFAILLLLICACNFFFELGPFCKHSLYDLDYSVKRIVIMHSYLFIASLAVKPLRSILRALLFLANIY